MCIRNFPMIDASHTQKKFLFTSDAAAAAAAAAASEH